MILDRYELIEPIGSGGMATVWKAVDHSLERTVAIKRLDPKFASDPVAAGRFRREAQAAARLSHPGIVTVFDTGEDQDGPFIVLELIEGETLGGLLDRSGPLAVPVAVTIIRQVADALDHAHANGVIHRDIKPSNFIIEANGKVRLTDFGIARVADNSTITDEGDLVGTIAYIAPEILAGGQATAASDIYSLGAVTYEMVSGRPPFQADHPAALLSAVRSGEFEPLTDVDVSIAAAVTDALSREPALRPATARSFATLLVAGTTLPIEPQAIPALPTSARVGQPTLIIPGAGTKPPPMTRWRWVVVAMVGLLAVAAAALFDPSPPTSGSTTDPAAATDTANTNPSSTTSSATTVPTLDETSVVAAALFEALDQLRPPENKPKDVREVEEALVTLMEKWTSEDIEDLADQFEEIFHSLKKLSDTPERDDISAMLVDLAAIMGVEMEPKSED